MEISHPQSDQALSKKMACKSKRKNNAGSVLKQIQTVTLKLEVRDLAKILTERTAARDAQFSDLLSIKYIYDRILNELDAHREGHEFFLSPS